MTPSVSVLLPVRDAATTIQAAVETILCSTLGDLELVLVNDASKDGTRAVLERLGKQDARVRLFDNPRPGLVPAVNFGVTQCRAPFIARMDADDLSRPDRLEKQYRYLKGNAVDGIGGRVRIVDGNGAPVPSLRRYEAWVNSNLDPDAIAAYRFVESPLVNPTVMVRREVFEMGHRDGPWPEDYDFWLRALNRGFRFAKLPEVVLDWMDRPTRMTRHNPRYTPEAFDRCRRLHLLEGPLRSHGEVDVWGAGQTGKPWLRWLLDQGLRVRKVIEVSPRKIGSTLHQVPVLGPDQLTPADGTPLVIAVGAAGARELIREHIHALGHAPGLDAWFVA